MQDDEIELTNTCADLVSLKKNEAFPRYLLATKRSGEWINVPETCQQLELAAGETSSDLFATWLVDPVGQDGYCVVVFYDRGSQWIMAAQYNRGRLLGGDSTAQSQQPAGVARALGPGVKPFSTAGAAER